VIGGGVVAGLCIVAAGAFFNFQADEILQPNLSTKENNVSASIVGSSGYNCCVFDGSTLSCEIVDDISSCSDQDFAITKTASVPNACPGDIIDYTIDYRNTSDVDLTTVNLTDDYDQQYVMLSGNLPTGCTDDGDTITCQIGALADHATGSFTYSMEVKGDALSAADSAALCL